MLRYLKWLLWVTALCLAACSSPVAERDEATATAVPTPAVPSPAPTADPFYRSDGRGEPRSSGYWKVWSTCTEGNKADVAAANGGREAGWFLMDDLLESPGVLVGSLAVETCEQGVNILDRMDAAGQVKAGDAAYELASQLLTAQVNLAVGAEFCPAVDDAVRAGQLLLLSLGFDGSGSYLAPEASSEDRELALFLADQLTIYNSGALCQ